jgi:Leucine-rich repeat (LRR) protein
MLDGPIPDLSANSRLARLDLSNNQLTGPLDVSLFQINSLELLYLSNNKLSGQIPANFGGNRNLVDLYLDNNLFEGPIPEILNSSTLRNIRE